MDDELWDLSPEEERAHQRALSGAGVSMGCFAIGLFAVFLALLGALILLTNLA